MGVKELKFDINKVKKVSIDDIRVNNWNPKEENTKEFKGVVKSIELNGLRDFIVVRTNPDENTTYEVIDGHQRFTAAKQLAYSEVFIYDEGEVSDKDAKLLTASYQKQVPFEKVAEAFFITEFRAEYGDAEIGQLYSELEMEDAKQLAEFDFDKYDATGPNGDIGNKDDKNIRTLVIKLEKDKYDMIMDIIHQVTESEDCNEGRALELICADYFSNANIIARE